MWGWREADADTAWLIASDVVGWVSREELLEVRGLRSELSVLESRRARLEEELATAVASARAEAFAASRHEVERLVDALAERPKEVARRTALLAMLIAEAMLGRLAEQESAVLERLLALALEGLSSEHNLLVRAGPRIAEAVRDRLASSGEALEVRADGSLSGADLVVEFAQGQSDSRMRSQLALLQTLLESIPDDP